MALKPHLQIFAPARDTNDYEPSFHLFRMLPKELRFYIWRYALERRRIIRMKLEGRREARASPELEAIKPFEERKRYNIIVGGQQVLSKLLRVNNESREETLKFYRVHLPCRFTNGETGIGAMMQETTAGVFHFNPEFDILHISPEWQVTDTLIPFLYHLKTTYDPCHVGLLNLAVQQNDICAHDLLSLQSSDLEPAVRTTFVKTLAQLHEVFFVSTPRAGRTIVGPLSGLPTSDTMFNRSFPIMAMPPAFERLQRDPHSIGEDLRCVFVATSDPRQMPQAWFRLLKKWKISPTRTEYRFLLTYDPAIGGHPSQICDRSGAESWLQEEDDRWNGRCKADWGLKIKWSVGAEHPKFLNEDLGKVVRPAFGFWLFPLDALGLLQEQGIPEDEGFRSLSKRMLNMSAYWPELALSSLS